MQEIKSLIVDKEDTEFIDLAVSSYAKESIYFQQQKSPGNGPDRTVLSDEGLETVYRFVLQGRIELQAKHIHALETLNGFGEAGAKIGDVSIEMHPAIVSTYLQESEFNLNQKMINFALSDKMDEWNALQEKYLLARTVPQQPLVRITETGKKTIETVKCISEKLIAEHDRIKQDIKIQKNIKSIFPKFREPLPRELVIDIIPPNGKDYYEQLKIRSVPNDPIVPNNSFVLSHIKGAPSQVGTTGNNETVLHEFAFAINDKEVRAYYMQNLTIYKDAERATTDKFYASPSEIKNDMLHFTEKMVLRVKSMNKGMER